MYLLSEKQIGFLLFLQAPYTLNFVDFSIFFLVLPQLNVVVQFCAVYPCGTANISVLCVGIQFLWQT